jgi:uncharacterized protein (DUF433 family)
MTIEQASPLLGRGIYDVTEVAHLVRRQPGEVARWAADAAQPLLLPQRRRLFSFHDLITAEVVAELRWRHVPLDKIRDARRWLAGELKGNPWPFAHAVGLRTLASVGGRVYFDDGVQWLDASEGGQLPFNEVVEPLLQVIEFADGDLMASAWRPVDGVVLDPAIQAGAPCLEGTRLTTDYVAGLVKAGEEEEDVASDYAVDLLLVQHAVAYERSLALAA